MPDDYLASLDYLYGRLNYERVGMPRHPAELRLGRMRRLLRALGDPQDAFPIVHIAGTKGKGSTAILIAEALTASGIKTGLFCSPHLHRLEERFRIDRVDATNDELVELVEAVRPAVADLDETHPVATFFEITTAMGLLHFARKRAGAVVLEVGMGGRLDSTNAIRPAVAVVTSISFDHTRQLGSTLAAIAREKAGIIKHRRPTVSGVLGEEARPVIRAVAQQRRSRLYEIETDFRYQYSPPPAPVTAPDPGSVTVETWCSRYGPRPLPLLGPHQAQNAATALAALDALAEQGIAVSPAHITSAWSGLTFPARVEILGQAPWLIVDGAHNVASAQALADTLRLCLPDVPRTLVFGTTRDKDLLGQLQALVPLFSRFVATRYRENPRAVPAEDVAGAIATLTNQPIHVAAGPADALAVARGLTPRDGLLCITGSLFLAAECRAVLLGLEPAPLLDTAAP